MSDGRSNLDARYGAYSPAEPTAAAPTGQMEGRELDMWLQEHALGWHRVTFGPETGLDVKGRWWLQEMPPDGTELVAAPPDAPPKRQAQGGPYLSSDNNAALGPLCDAMRARGWLLTLHQRLDGGWRAVAYPESIDDRRIPGYAWEDTPAEALARAAHAALSAEAEDRG